MALVYAGDATGGAKQIHVETKPCPLNLQPGQKMFCENSVFLSKIYGLIQECLGDTSGL